MEYGPELPADRAPGMGSGRRRRRSSGEAAPHDGAGNLATALGWFSVGLGLAQIVSPRGVARLVGARADDDTARLMRFFGLRELTAGVGILSKRRQDVWMRARVAGDMLDLAMLGRTLVSNESRRERTVGATMAVLGVTALDILAANRLGDHQDGARASATRRTEAAGQRGRDDITHDADHDIKHVRRAITINRPIEEVAAFWRESGGDEAVLDETVRFVPAPGGRGTEVHLDRAYKRPGRIASVIATLRHDDPAQHVFDELFALKQILETGDVVTSDAWMNGPHAPHPAQPEA